MSVKFPFFGGGFWGGGGGECRFYFYGRADFSDISFHNKTCDNKIRGFLDRGRFTANLARRSKNKRPAKTYKAPFASVGATAIT